MLALPVKVGGDADCGHGAVRLTVYSNQIIRAPLFEKLKLGSATREIKHLDGRAQS